MDKKNETFYAFVGNCLIDEEPISTWDMDNSLCMEQEDEPKTCLVSLMDEPKVA